MTRDEFYKAFADLNKGDELAYWHSQSLARDAARSEEVKKLRNAVWDLCAPELDFTPIGGSEGSDYPKGGQGRGYLYQRRAPGTDMFEYCVRRIS